MYLRFCSSPLPALLLSLVVIPQSKVNESENEKKRAMRKIETPSRKGRAGRQKNKNKIRQKINEGKNMKGRQGGGRKGGGQ